MYVCMLNFHRHCNSKLVVQKQNCVVPPVGYRPQKWGVRCIPTPPVAQPMVAAMELYCDNEMTIEQQIL